MSLPLRNSAGDYPTHTDPCGYPIIYETEQGGVLCGECASSHAEPVGVPSDYNLTDCRVNFEDNSIFCHCCKSKIGCVYEDPLLEQATQVQIGDYFTVDYVEFYQLGQKIITVKPDENWWEVVKERMELEAFWKSVWFVCGTGLTVRPVI